MRHRIGITYDATVNEPIRDARLWYRLNYSRFNRVGVAWFRRSHAHFSLAGLTIVPAFLLAGLFRDAALFKIVAVLPTLLFFAWNPNLLRDEAKIPKRSYVLFSTAIVLSAVYFIASWKWGIQYQGIRYVQTICAINLVWTGFVAFAFALSLKQSSSFGLNLFLHWILFAWQAWYAFPYLGELP